MQAIRQIYNDLSGYYGDDDNIIITKNEDIFRNVLSVCICDITITQYNGRLYCDDRIFITKKYLHCEIYIIKKLQKVLTT